MTQVRHSAARLHPPEASAYRSRRPLPIIARSAVHRRRVEAAAYDCVRVLLVLDGSAIFTIGERAIPLRPGHAVLVGPDKLLGYAPENSVSVTTLLIDTDYLIEHLFWQHLDVIADRDAARDLATKLYPEPVQVLDLGQQEVESLDPILEELVTLTATEHDAAGYFRTHALLLTVLSLVAPRIRHASFALRPPSTRQRRASVSTPRWRQFAPLRTEARAVEALLRSDIARRWRRDELATHVRLSSSQMGRVFAAAYGVTPLVYLTILRVEEMARLIRETDLSVEAIGRRVGWRNRDFSATAFRHHFGVNPSVYRREGPPNASDEGPGVAVAHAAPS